MIIAFITDNGFSEKKGSYYYSGANVQHYSTVSQHFEDIIFVARNNPYESSGNLIAEKYQVYLVDSVVNHRKFIRNFNKLNDVLEDVVKRSDVVMCFGLNGYFAYKKAIKYNKPTIVYIGGCVYDTLVNMDSKLKKALAPIMMSMVKEMAKNANFVHYVDGYLVDKYPTRGEKLICPSAKITINPEVMKTRESNIQQKMKKTTIGLIGYTHNKIKGIDTAIKSLKILGENYRLQIVGRGEHTWLDNLAKSLGVEKQVEFLGVMSGREAIFNWLDTIDIYIQPSVTEGMPRATIEAMSRACPVVSSHAGGLRNIVNEKFRIDAGNYTALADKIRMIGENKSLMLKQAQNSFNVAKKFDSNVLNGKRNQFYNNIYHKLQQ
ncbi:glycosyltransferase family 4 protein [Peribacillus asahii]|uniref:glycosyltransferase family 4 protein n=1 Tax=Peribacillus asahii TaxID=228899 RepID=UPI0037FA551D